MEETITERENLELYLKLNPIYNGNVCKNQHYSISEFEEEVDGEIKKRFRVVNDVCNNLRRNGSAYCQECSDKHNK